MSKGVKNLGVFATPSPKLWWHWFWRAVSGLFAPECYGTDALDCGDKSPHSKKPARRRAEDYCSLRFAPGAGRAKKRGIRPSHGPHRRLYSAASVSLESCLIAAVMLEARRGPCFVHNRALVGWAMLGLVFCTASFGGCVQRRMTVRTNPPGALLYVDDYEIGATPVSTNFIYYGKRKIRLVKDGYETLTVMQDIPPPWYEFMPLDFVAENFVPGHIRDQRVLDYQLRPQAVVPTEQLLWRAENLRRGIHSATGTATGPSAGAVRGPAALQPSAGAEAIPAPEGVGGQTVHPLPPR